LVNSSLPVANLSELLALAKAKPGSLAFATAGSGSNSNLYVEYLRREKGIDFLNVPYKSFVQGLTALAANEVQGGNLRAWRGAESGEGRQSQGDRCDLDANARVSLPTFRRSVRPEWMSRSTPG